MTKRCKAFKELCRTHEGVDEYGLPMFHAQYVDMLLGRFDHPVSADKDDMETRLDYDDLRVGQPAWSRVIGHVVECRMLGAWKDAGTKRAEIIDRHRPKPGRPGGAAPDFRFLVDAATGSWTSPVPVHAMEGEVDPADVNKKPGYGSCRRRNGTS